MISIEQFSVEKINDIKRVLKDGKPYIILRSDSDYWTYSTFFKDSCLVAVSDGIIIGVVIAYYNQSDISELYIQDVFVASEWRGKGIATKLIKELETLAASRGCSKIWLTSKPENIAALSLWKSLGFVNKVTDIDKNGMWLTKNLKGPGKDRAIFIKLIL